MALIVNGDRIEDSVIQQEFERLRPHYERTFGEQSPEEQKAQLLEWSKENVIEKVLVNQEAKKRAVQVSQMLEDVCKDMPEPLQEDIVKFYEENKERFGSPEQIRVAHIVKYINWHADERAAYKAMIKAWDELNSGAVFETVADRHTDCGDKGGDLGYVTKGQLVEEFEDVVFNLSVGEVSDVFRTRFGFHIAKLYDRRPAVVPELEEVKGRLVNAVAEKMREKTVEEFIDRLRSKAKIEEV